MKHTQFVNCNSFELYNSTYQGMGYPWRVHHDTRQHKVQAPTEHVQKIAIGEIDVHQKKHNKVLLK